MNILEIPKRFKFCETTKKFRNSKFLRMTQRNEEEKINSLFEFLAPHT